MANPSSPYRTARLACVLGALLLLPLAYSPAGQRAAVAPRSELSAFVARARGLLSGGDMGSLRALAAAPESLAWVGQKAGFGRGRPEWALDVVALPSSGPEPTTWLAVFHSFHTCESIGDHLHPLVHTAEGWRFGAEILETDTRGFRVRDHRLAVTFDLPASSCRITDDVTFERTLPEAGICLLRLSSDMRLDSATRGGSAFPVRAAPGVIAFVPPAEKRFQVTFSYHGTVKHGFSDYIRPGEVALLSYWYPHIARLPSTATVTATVPRGWTAIAAGELTKRAERPDSTTFTWRNDVPICYLTLDAGPYDVTSRQVGGRTIYAYLIKPNPELARSSLDAVAGALPVFEKAFGTYPYTRYTVVQTAGTIGGAMEAYSFATFDPGTLPGAVVHELSHTWWGGIVPNPYTRDMWNEWFASYSEGLYRRLSGQAPGRAIRGMHGDRDRFFGGRQGSFPVPMAQAFDTSDGAQSAAGYGKGSLVLGMLEDLLGTETMVRAMRRFREDHSRGEAADWEDFQRAVNRTTGADWGWFFDQWVRRGGVPQVRLDDVKTAQEGGQYVVTGRIAQDGVPYRLRLPLALQTADGETVKAEVDASGASTPFRLAGRSVPRQLRLDPDGNVLMSGFGDGDPFTWTP